MSFAGIELELDYFDIQEDGEISLKDTAIFDRFFIELSEKDLKEIKQLCPLAYDLLMEYMEKLKELTQILIALVERYNANLKHGETGIDVLDNISLNILLIQEKRKELLELVKKLQLKKIEIEQRLKVEKNPAAKRILNDKLKSFPKIEKEITTFAGQLKTALKTVKSVSGVVAGASSIKTLDNSVSHLCRALGEFKTTFENLTKLILHGGANSSEVKKLLETLQNLLAKGEIARRVTILKEAAVPVGDGQRFSADLNEKIQELCSSCFEEIASSMAEIPGAGSLANGMKKVKAVVGGIRKIKKQTNKKVLLLLKKFGVPNGDTQQAIVWAVEVWVCAQIYRDDELNASISTWSRRVAVAGLSIGVAGCIIGLCSCAFALASVPVLSATGFAICLGVEYAGAAVEVAGMGLWDTQRGGEEYSRGAAPIPAHRQPYDNIFDEAKALTKNTRKPGPDADTKENSAQNNAKDAEKDSSASAAPKNNAKDAKKDNSEANAAKNKNAAVKNNAEHMRPEYPDVQDLSNIESSIKKTPPANAESSAEADEENNTKQNENPYANLNENSGQAGFSP